MAIIRIPIEELVNVDIIGFDVDGCIVDSTSLIHVAFNIYAGKYGEELSFEFVKKNIMPGTPEEMVSTFQRYLRERGKDLDGSLEDEIERWKTAYKDCDMMPAVFPGAVEMLYWAKQRGKHVPLISSAYRIEVDRNTEAIESERKRLGIEGELYDCTVAYEDIQLEGRPAEPKPNLYPMIVAHERMDLPPGEYRCAFVGDSGSDMAFARELHGRAIFLETNTTEANIEHRPDIICANIGELYQMVKDLG